MIKAVIVEDEQRSARTLNKMLSDYCPGVEIAGIAANIKDGKSLIETKKPELVFLDIQLPDGDSFSLLNIVKGIDFKVIFTTAHSDYALKALKCSALDYLLKPVNIDELIVAVDKFKSYKQDINYIHKLDALRENINNDNKGRIKTIGLATLNEIQFVVTDDIIRLEAASNYTHFYIEGLPKITVSHTLKHYENLLNDSSFMRVHQSSIINLRKVKKYIRGKTGSILMTDGCTIDISPKKKEEFLNALNWL